MLGSLYGSGLLARINKHWATMQFHEKGLVKKPFMFSKSKIPKLNTLLKKIRNADL